MIIDQNKKCFVNPFWKNRNNEMKIRMEFWGKWIRKASKHWTDETVRDILFKRKRNGLQLKNHFSMSLCSFLFNVVFSLHFKFLSVVNRFFSIHLYVHFRKDFGLLFKPSKSWALHVHTYTLRHNHVKWGKASLFNRTKTRRRHTYIHK